MKSLVTLLILSLLLCHSASAAPLTKEQLFALYVDRVPQATIALRLNQLFTNLPAGAFKNTAKAALKQDLLDAVQAQLDTAAANIQDVHNRADAAEASVVSDIVAPITADQTNVTDTTLP